MWAPYRLFNWAQYQPFCPENIGPLWATHHIAKAAYLVFMKFIKKQHLPQLRTAQQNKILSALKLNWAFPHKFKITLTMVAYCLFRQTTCGPDINLSVQKR